MSEWNNVIRYFKPPENYFWHWTEAGFVIEWREGETICYREDLINILKKLNREGWPPLGAMLLVLSACRETPGTAAADQGVIYPALRLIDFFEKNRLELKFTKDSMAAAIRFLQLVAALPVELRTGNTRTWLLYVIFRNATTKIKHNNTAYFINVFNSGKVDGVVFGINPKDRSTAVVAGVIDGNITTHTGKAFIDDMAWLQMALQAFPTEAELETAVRTGMPDVPNAAEVEEAIQEAGDLLEQLEQDPGTAGLAQLTQRLIAALNIPMHAHGSSDQLFGGVSDITNRGNFDRLLLSELAHDDLSLMARLANNEALYLRREELPSQPEKQRILLIDTTIKMWGLPRVFAVSAALACARNNKAKAQISSYALFGNAFKEVDLTTKAGVVNSLEQLDASLHCGRALTVYMDQAKLSAEDEVFLITEEETTHNVLFQSILASLKKPVNFLVTVNRSGQLQFYEYRNGHRKLLSEAKFDLQELLCNTKRKEKTQVTRTLSAKMPAIMGVDPAPLFFPTSKIRFTAECFYELRKDHVVCVTIDQRVLYWNSRTRGAREIIEYLEPGRFCFGSIDDSIIYILVYSGHKRDCRLYEINLNTNSVEITKLPERITQVTEMGFDTGKFYIKANSHLYWITAVNGRIQLGGHDTSKHDDIVNRYKNRLVNLSYFKKLVNDGYTTLNSVKSVYINHNGDLGFDERHVALKDKSGMIVIEHNQRDRNKSWKEHAAKEVEVLSVEIPSENLRFSKFVWKDGSEVLADSRGFLHLRSSDASIPEITIVMIMGKPTACWAADGSICGPAYFTGIDAMNSPGIVSDFYNSYIKRFIDTVIDHGANTKV
jgi:hypothetical protein